MEKIKLLRIDLELNLDSEVELSSYIGDFLDEPCLKPLKEDIECLSKKILKIVQESRLFNGKN